MSELIITLTPKINQPGGSPAPAGDASSMGCATLTGPDNPGRRPVRIERRPAGSTSDWTTVKAEDIGTDKAVYFAAWSVNEYRAIAPPVENFDKVVSDTATYDWNLVFSDEFDSDLLDLDTWSLRGPSYREDATRAKGDLRAIEVANGTALVKAIEDPDRGPGWWLNGHVGTQGRFEFTYGWAAARVNFQKGSGSHSAFWVQSKTGYQPGDTEIDVAEYFGHDFPGDPDMCHNLYWKNAATDTDHQSWKRNTDDLVHFDNGNRFYNSYHVYSVHWQEDRYDFYIDGDRVWTSKVGLSSSPHFLVLSMITKDYEIKHMDGPRSMSVDWVRVWQ